jgi:Membrane bound beta barrel domain (DUF5777)
MKLISKISDIHFQQIGLKLKMTLKTLFLMVFALTAIQLTAQEEVETKKETKPVRDMFESTWLIDNQTVIVPIKGTFQMDIIHRFGTLNNGYKDLYGIFASSNIKLGFNYSILDNLSVGFGITKTFMTWDMNVKYAILQQTRSGSIPLSVTYFGNAAIDTRTEDNFINGSDRVSFFHQLIIARKVSSKFSIQVAPSLSHYNAVEAFINPDKEKVAVMKNDHFAISAGGRFKVADQIALIANYDQPITKHFAKNPQPNLSFGIEMSTSSHSFQVFISNYNYIIPQRNNVFNQNDYKNGDFLIGFNITRLWN